MRRFKKYFQGTFGQRWLKGEKGDPLFVYCNFFHVYGVFAFFVQIELLVVVCICHGFCRLDYCDWWLLLLLMRNNSICKGFEKLCFMFHMIQKQFHDFNQHDRLNDLVFHRSDDGAAYQTVLLDWFAIHTRLDRSMSLFCRSMFRRKKMLFEITFMGTRKFTKIAFE